MAGRADRFVVGARRAARTILALTASFGASLVPACARTAAAVEASTESLVEVTYVGDRPEPLDAVVRDRLSRLPVRFASLARASLDMVEAASESDCAACAARVWLDTRDARTVTIFLLDARHETLLLRTVPLPNGLDEVAREEIGNILEGSVTALLAGRPVGAPRRDVLRALASIEAPEAGSPAPAARPPPRIALAAGVSWEAVALTQAVIQQGPSIVARVAFGRSTLRPALQAFAQYRLPVDARGTDVDVRLDGISTRLLAALDVGLTETLTLSPGIGAGVDLARVDPRAASARATPDAARSLTIPILRSALELRARFASRWVGHVAIAADLDPTGTFFFVQHEAGQAEAVFSPWRVRPVLGVGLALAF